MIICWWSGGVTSAVACKIAINLYGADNCRVIFMDTFNEHPDTYRFKTDCAKWYGIEIETITGIGEGETYNSIQDVWYKHLSLNVANGAICSYKLKRLVRENWQKVNKYRHQVFGFEFSPKEFNRSLSLALNHPKARPIFPLLMLGHNKARCIEIIKEAEIDIPEAYKLGFSNNNCLSTFCIQGGVGYWQKIFKEYPKEFGVMAKVEHDLTRLKGQPVTMLKDQSNKAKEKKKTEKYSDLVFLIKNKNYPDHKCLADMKPRKVEPLVDCNGFCGVDELNKRSETVNDLNMELNE